MSVVQIPTDDQRESSCRRLQATQWLSSGYSRIFWGLQQSREKHFRMTCLPAHFVSWFWRRLWLLLMRDVPSRQQHNLWTGGLQPNRGTIYFDAFALTKVQLAYSATIAEGNNGAILKLAISGVGNLISSWLSNVDSRPEAGSGQVRISLTVEWISCSPRALGKSLDIGTSSTSPLQAMIIALSNSLISSEVSEVQKPSMTNVCLIWRVVMGAAPNTSHVNMFVARLRVEWPDWLIRRKIRWYIFSRPSGNLISAMIFILLFWDKEVERRNSNINRAHKNIPSAPLARCSISRSRSFDADSGNSSSSIKSSSLCSQNSRMSNESSCFERLSCDLMGTERWSWATLTRLRRSILGLQAYDNRSSEETKESLSLHSSTPSTTIIAFGSRQIWSRSPKVPSEASSCPYDLDVIINVNLSTIYLSWRQPQSIWERRERNADASDLDASELYRKKWCKTTRIPSSGWSSLSSSSSRTEVAKIVLPDPGCPKLC